MLVLFSLLMLSSIHGDLQIKLYKPEKAKYICESVLMSPSFLPSKENHQSALSYSRLTHDTKLFNPPHVCLTNLLYKEPYAVAIQNGDLYFISLAISP